MFNLQSLLVLHRMLYSFQPNVLKDTDYIRLAIYFLLFTTPDLVAYLDSQLCK